MLVLHSVQAEMRARNEARGTVEAQRAWLARALEAPSRRTGQAQEPAGGMVALRRLVSLMGGLR